MVARAVASFPVPDFDYPGDERYHRRQLASAVRSMRDGKINTGLDFDLDVQPAIQTIVEDNRIGITTRMILTPGNIHAAAELASGTIELDEDDITNGQFIIKHLRSTLTRSFRAVLLV